MLSRSLILLVAAALILGTGSGALAYSNIALNQPVTLSGSFGTDPPPAAKETVDDGVFLAEETPWQSGTVWWTDSASTVKITLDQKYLVDKFLVQADCNDYYDVTAYDGATPVYTAHFPYKGVFGMITRDPIILATAISCDSLVLQAFPGDNMYAVSEIQAFGNPVPVPASLILLGSGLLGLVRWRRR